MVDRLGDAIHKNRVDFARILGKGECGQDILIGPVVNLLDTIVSDKMSVL